MKVFKIVKCRECQQILGHYNSRFYSYEALEEISQKIYQNHIKKGHTLAISEYKVPQEMEAVIFKDSQQMVR